MNREEMASLKDAFEFMRLPNVPYSGMRQNVIQSMPMSMQHMHSESDMSMQHMHSEPDMPMMSRFPKQTPIGMAYVPYQQWGETYTAEEALCRGTLFPEIDYPFGGGDCTNE